MALGRGDLKLIQVLNRLTPSDKGASIVQPEPQLLYTPQRKSKVCIEGVGNLLTHMARCCQPLPGEQVIGYITVGRGVSIHRQDCPNVLRATEKQQERFLVVTWDEYHPKI